MFHLVQRGTQGRLSVEAEGIARAPAATVWRLVFDAASYPEWGPWSDAGYHQHGEPAPGGAGAVRWFRYGRTTTVERVLAAVPGERLSYTVIGGIPVRNYRADITLTPAADGTLVRWQACWDRSLGGMIVRRTLVRLYPEIMRRLIAAAEQAAPAGSGS
jgi:uncharacterized protein YndB with AHSA1/START domain